ncbi:serine--tRNA ligase [Fulvivirgaceae bacterium LMO-SS25]
MLPITRIREEKEQLIAGLLKRNFQNAALLIENALKLDDRRKELKSEMDAQLTELNTISKSIGELMRAGKKEEAEERKLWTGQLKEKSKNLGDELQAVEKELQDLLYTIPNVPHSSVPAGKSADDNEEIFKHGEIPQLPDGALPHWELIRKYDIIDFELGTKITGAGFPVYKGKGARIQRALINFFLDNALEAGYVEILPPFMVNEASGYGTGQLPDKEGQMYHMTADDLYLIPTAEVPVTNLYRDVILNANDLPVKNVAYTPCFRREAGSWGAHVRGLNRLHQFDKVEIVQVRLPEESYQALEDMSQYVQGLLKKLELPYRVLRLCGGDMGFTSALTYDMEVFSAAQERWLEVSSVSNFEDYQANRLKLRYKGEDKKSQLLHTLNGSALALPRILAAILENNQTEAGIRVPSVLVPYTGFEFIN